MCTRTGPKLKKMSVPHSHKFLAKNYPKNLEHAPLWLKSGVPPPMYIYYYYYTQPASLHWRSGAGWELKSTMKHLFWKELFPATSNCIIYLLLVICCSGKLKFQNICGYTMLPTSLIHHISSIQIISSIISKQALENLRFHVCISFSRNQRIACASLIWREIPSDCASRLCLRCFGRSVASLLRPLTLGPCNGRPISFHSAPPSHLFPESLSSHHRIQTCRVYSRLRR